MKGTDFILEALRKEGIGHLFMVPGALIDPFLPALAKVPEIKPVVAAMEAGAAYMADGYARASGNFGVCLAIGGPGVTNMTTAVSAAWTDGSPVLVISGEVPTAIGGTRRIPGCQRLLFMTTRPSSRPSPTFPWASKTIIC